MLFYNNNTTIQTDPLNANVTKNTGINGFKQFLNDTANILLPIIGIVGMIFLIVFIII